MKTIFFNSRSLILCGKDRPGDEDPGAVIMVDNGEEALSEAIRTIDTNESISRLYILCQNIEDTYNRLRTRFTEIDAAGGLVRDSNGQYLLILRNGIWDLPKGGKRGRRSSDSNTRSHRRNRHSRSGRRPAHLRNRPHLPPRRPVRAQAHPLVCDETHSALLYQASDRGRHNADSMDTRCRTARLRGTDLPFHQGSPPQRRTAPRAYITGLTQIRNVDILILHQTFRSGELCSGQFPQPLG